MSEETRIQLTLDTGGSVPAVAKLREEIEQLKVVLQKQAQAYADGDLPLEEFIRGNKAARTVIGELEGTLKSIQPEVEEVSAGFADLAENVRKIERAGMGLATGHGLRGATNALEQLALAAGGPAGVGIAIGAIFTAIDVIGPKLETWIEGLLGTKEAAEKATEALKKHVEQIKKTAAEAEALTSQPSKEEADSEKGIKELLKGAEGEQVRYGITEGLRERGIGKLTEKEKQDYYFKHPELQGVSHREEFETAIRNEQDNILKEATDRMLVDLPKSADTQNIVAGMAEKHPGHFTPGFAQGLSMSSPSAVKERNEAVRAEHEAGKESDEWGRARKEGIKLRDELVADEAKHLRETERLKAREKAKRHRVEAAQRKEDAEIVREGNEEDAEEKRAEAKAKADARANTPEAINRREREQMRSGIMGRMQQEDRANVAQGFPKASPDFIRKATDQALQNVDMGSNITAAIEYAIRATQAKIDNDVNRWRARQEVMSEGP